jgi:cytochrome c556
MKGLVCAVSAAALMVVASLLVGSAGAQDAKKNPPSIKKIMSKLNAGKKAPIKSVGGALKSETPDWPVVLKDAKVIAEYGAYLPKLTPPKGSKESWEKLSTAFADSGKELETAAGKEDLKAARAASKALSTSCKACHTEHQDK